MKRAILIYGLFLSSIIFSQTNNLGNVTLEINYDKEDVFYPNDYIPIRITIKNNSAETYRFKLAENKTFNTEVNVYGLDNKALVESDKFSSLKSYENPILYREVSILPGEEFSFVQNLSDYREIKEGVYVVSAKFYPNLNVDTITRKSVLESNKLALSVKPAFLKGDTGAKYSEELKRNIVERLKQLNMPPDEVVTYLIKARIENNREKFFLYLDAESLYTKNTRAAYIYKRQSEDGRTKILNQYKDQLWASEINDDISMVPMDYEVVSTSYSGVQAEVIVRQTYKFSPKYIEAKRFTYHLDKRDNIWIINGYEVLNLGNKLIE